MRPGPETPLWESSRFLLQERGGDFLHRLPRALKTFEPEEIHDLRVASRRLCEALILFEPCYPPGKLSSLRKEVRKVVAALGDLRNIDEAFLFFDAVARDLPAGTGSAVDGLLSELLDQRREEAGRLEQELLRVQKGPLKRRMEKIIPFPLLFRLAGESADPFLPLSGFGRLALEERMEEVLSLAEPARREEDAEAQHRLRIAVKKFRYRLEILEDLQRENYGRLQAELKDYQTLLGHLHDMDVFAGLAASLAEGQERELVQGSIGDRRSALHRRFLEKQEEAPFSLLGEQWRSAW